jgi:hypothetical protein
MGVRAVETITASGMGLLVKKGERRAERGSAQR